MTTPTHAELIADLPRLNALVAEKVKASDEAKCETATATLWLAAHSTGEVRLYTRESARDAVCANDPQHWLPIGTLTQESK